MHKIVKIIENSVKVKQLILEDNNFIEKIQSVSNKIIETYKQGGKLLLCGNGGSAADAQHIAAELSGRFYINRPPLNAEALHVNTSYITAVANDFSFDEIYARLVLAFGKKNDMLIAFSTSGNSENILKAALQAKKLGMQVIGFTGETGGKLKEYCSILLNVPSMDTPRIQEAHIMIGHIICQLVENVLFVENVNL